MQTIWISKKDIEDIGRVLKKFPKIERFQLSEHGESGIGTCLDMIFETEVNDIKCRLVVPIADESTW